MSGAHAHIEAADEHGVAHAVERLGSGGLIGLPTETVYGLAADAHDADAVARIFAAKGRPADHPLIVHVASAEAAAAWAATWPDAARRLAETFWPGPMTLIVRAAAHVLPAVTGGQDTVGLRVPSHPVAQAVLRAMATAKRRTVGLAAPSANRFGHVSPTTAEHVRAEFPDLDLLILDGGASAIGVESTIIDVSTEAVRVLRPGRIRRDDIVAVLGSLPLEAGVDAPRVSGSLATHYAPRTPSVLMAGEHLKRQLRAFRQAKAAQPRRCVITHSFTVESEGTLHGIRLDADAKAWEHELYALLRRLDGERYAQLLIEAPPASAEWDAVTDRLRRATHGQSLDAAAEQPSTP
ncbi:MAG: threonylcarbamoyl-AMP synthase [Burkholderiales bacterium]|nr:threonylcarbamoyl-AMP synthase [Burkholderiales bacterium]